MQKSNASSENVEFVRELRASENLCTGEVDALYVGPRSQGMPSGYKVPCASLQPPDTEETRRDAAFMCPVPAGKGLERCGEGRAPPLATTKCCRIDVAIVNLFLRARSLLPGSSTHRSA